MQDTGQDQFPLVCRPGQVHLRTDLIRDGDIGFPIQTDIIVAKEAAGQLVRQVQRADSVWHVLPQRPKVSLVL
jgi:hypothetical protein